MKPLLTAQSVIDAPIEKVWDCWITPADIMNWNNPSTEWHTPFVQNEMETGGSFLFRMEAKDGSASFDYKGKYDHVILHKLIQLTTTDGRISMIRFESRGAQTLLVEEFEPEEKTPVALQKDFCQGVIDTFKRYVENKK